MYYIFAYSTFDIFPHLTYSAFTYFRLFMYSAGVKYALFKEHKSYVQGVAFDPLGNYVATLSADR